MKRLPKIFQRIPTFRRATATQAAVQHSDALGPRERWESKVAVRTNKKELVGIPVFDDLVRVYEPEIRRFITRKVDLEATDDVLQEVWVAAWQSFETVKDRSNVRAWIYGICLHKCHDHYRSRKREGRLVPITDIEIVDPRPSPENLVLDSARISILLNNLDESQKEIIELYYYAQLTLAEIATVLNRNMNTVKYQFYRAHAALIEAGKKGEMI